MNLNSEKSSNDRRQTEYPSCLYNAMNPYSVYASSLSQNVYAAQTGQPKPAQDTMMHHKSTSACSSLGQNVYLQNFQMPWNELSGLQSISTALDSGYGLFYRAGVPDLNPTIQMTTDYTGLLDASNPLKCPKQVHPFYWRKRGNSEPAEGMTRTRDKYRVVYTDKQRVGLEKAFRENKFITLEKKKEISKELDLSERQIKIWFQNRRAKERRQKRKAETEQDETEQDENNIPVVRDSEMDDLSRNTVSSNIQPSDDFNDVGIHFPTHEYPVLQSLEKPCAKRQCRFQPTVSNSTFENERIPARQQDQPGRSLQQDQIGRRLSASPPEWVHPKDVMPTCTISPFSANPDFNLLYRT